VALGGITPANAAHCLNAGATAVAVMGEIMRARDTAAAVGDYLRVLDPDL
jgi:thiamine-phosphate pyrophosphorylase